MTTPHFIVIGAMKCGTSNLASQLAAQPGVFMTDPKEPNYFSDDPVYAQGPEWYAQLFAGAAAGAIRGEASTHYTKRPDYPDTIARMVKAVPNVRLVYMIRNPMARLVSHYIHAWSEGDVTGTLSDALNVQPNFVNYGLYGWQIAPFVETFGRNAILLTSLEQMQADPQAELTRIAAHVGISEPVIWKDDLEVQNVSRERVRKLPMHKLIVDNPAATALRRLLVPKALRDRIRESRKLTQRPEIPHQARATLEVQFAQDRTLLAGFFPEAPALNLAYPFL